MLLFSVVGNDFKTLLPGMMKDSAKMTELYYVDCNIQHVQKGAFDGLVGLEYLFLVGNHITRLEAGEPASCARQDKRRHQLLCSAACDRPLPGGNATKTQNGQRLGFWCARQSCAMRQHRCSLLPAAPCLLARARLPLIQRAVLSLSVCTLQAFLMTAPPSAR